MWVSQVSVCFCMELADRAWALSHCVVFLQALIKALNKRLALERYYF